MGFVEPTAIQLRAFPIVLAGKDLIGTAQTGTGKTAAFALPILTLLAKHGGFRCLVLEPTRELAAQVETAFRDYGRFTDLRVALVHGGVGYGKQREELKRGVDILVATPGRLLDLLEQRTMSLKEIKILVLDEVDRMLDMGFLPDVRRIVEKTSTKRQTFKRTTLNEKAKQQFRQSTPHSRGVLSTSTYCPLRHSIRADTDQNEDTEQQRIARERGRARSMGTPTFARRTWQNSPRCTAQGVRAEKSHAVSSRGLG